jgi:protein TonB
MSTTSKTASALGLLTVATLTVLVFAGACELPMPTEEVTPEAAVTPTTTPAAADPSAEPVFMPYTEPPAILNREEIIAALIEGYPRLLRDAGVGGTVGVYFHIDDTGTVQSTRIDESSGHPALDDAALAVASVYRFSPALNRDEPTSVWLSFPITFQVR